MDPLWVRPHDDLRTCKGCGRTDKHDGYAAYQCAVFDRNAAAGGRVLAGKALIRCQEMRTRAAAILEGLLEDEKNQQKVIDSLLDALRVAERNARDTCLRVERQQRLVDDMGRQTTLLIDNMRLAEHREEGEDKAMCRARERDSLFDDEMDDQERRAALQPGYWDSETEWWDRAPTEDEAESTELIPELQRRYDDWLVDDKEVTEQVRITSGRSITSIARSNGRHARIARAAYEARRDAQGPRPQTGDPGEGQRIIKQEEDGGGSRPPPVERNRTEDRQRRASEQRQRRSRVEAWAAGVQTPTPGPSVKREEDSRDVGVAFDLQDEYEYPEEGEGDYDEEDSEGEGDDSALPPLGVSPAFVKREETTDEALPIAVAASDRAQVKQESEPEPDPSRIQRESSGHFGAAPAAEASNASPGRPQRTTRRTRRTQPYPT